MDFIANHLLTLILFVPTLAAVVVLCLPKGEVRLIRWVALISSLVPLGLTLYLWANFNAGQRGFPVRGTAHLVCRA